MLSKSREDSNGVINLDNPDSPHLLQHTSPRSLEQTSSSVVEGTDVRQNVIQGSIWDQFLLERQEADAITEPLLDTENRLIKDLEIFLNHSDMLNTRKHELLHKRWTECVWEPVERSIKRRFLHCEGLEPMTMMHMGFDVKGITAPLRDPLFVYLRSRMKEMRAIFYCQTGCQWVELAVEKNRNWRDLYGGNRSEDPVYMAMADARCYRPHCWSAVLLSRS